MTTIDKTRVIIADHTDYFVNNPARIKINNLLVVSGGGISATFFAMGAVKYLIDNNLFSFDVISSVSGATILIHFIELAVSYKFNKEKNWYNKYIRDVFYDLASEPIAIKILLYGLDINGTKRAMNELFRTKIKVYDKIFSGKNDFAKFEYNYLDANTNHLSDDHRDLIDPDNNILVENWYTFRLLRCCLPFTSINNIDSYDAGGADNNGLTTVISKYDAKNIILISSFSDFIYAEYKRKNVLQLILNSLNSIINTSVKATSHLGQLALENKNTVICKYSNGLIMSTDKFHNGLFNDYYNDVPSFKSYYNGVFFIHLPMLKVIENEGYIQMKTALEKSKYIQNKNKIFDIPNPDVYNDTAKEIYEDFKKLDVIKAVIQSIFNEIQNRIKNNNKKYTDECLNCFKDV